MATSKFKMIRQAQTLAEQEQETARLCESKILEMADGDIEQAKMFTESVVNLLGQISAQLNAGKNPMEKLNPQQQQMLVRMLAGASVLKTQPEAAQAVNLNANRLRDMMARVGQKDANVALANVGDAAPSVEKHIQQLFAQYQQALTSGDEKALQAVKNEMNQLSLYWQQQQARMGQQQQPAAQAKPPAQQAKPFTPAPAGAQRAKPAA